MLANDLYQETTVRVMGLLTEPSGWDQPVAACPGWTVRNVVAHMAAVASDWADGSLSGAPSDDETAEHVARFAGRDNGEVLAAWSEAAERLAVLAKSSGLEPPAGDVACHEHDIRSAIGRPGARDAASVRWTADKLLTMLETPEPLQIVTEDAQYRSGPPGGTELVLRTTHFEALRWRTGRRSRAQLAAMDWSDDPAPVLEHLYLFGPAAEDVVE
ncbi:maleylpyruvate isomerase N-terminal domain-containing protein [Mycobacterium sp. 236(2023)]|uniref:maleylpyruvate isomerase N-terminal domain-containing protein n=1 Tax=Mycobacterium sp. 236(2023) TaxID=3038163 RepID=UPI002415505B|nr:maleylpyruvate isomerase N-terminal domain-containing protein [Mycobacterium sp. 236(2023)]MDG4663333.1 maleylpyruvate isomerase N-terminal domain-containing protein [Mycobacterium sp. 236(2023)]